MVFIEKIVRTIINKLFMKNKNNKNRIIVENGMVKPIINTEVMDLEEARNLLHDMIEKEYALP